MDQPLATTETSAAGPSALAGPSARRRGQPGNTNALKHGFYARKVPYLQEAALDVLETDPPGMQEEISSSAATSAGCSKTPPPQMAVIRISTSSAPSAWR